MLVRKPGCAAAGDYHAGRKPLFECGEYRCIGSAQTEAVVGDLVGIDVVACLEVFHGSHQVLGPANHELNLGTRVRVRIRREAGVHAGVDRHNECPSAAGNEVEPATLTGAADLGLHVGAGAREEQDSLVRRPAVAGQI